MKESGKQVKKISLGLALISLLFASGCSNDSESNTTPKATNEEVIVFAAASLKGAFTEMAQEFESQNSNTKVILNFGTNSMLSEQIMNGAAGDVVATSDEGTITSLAEKAGAPTNFASDYLALAVVVGNIDDVKGLPEFADPKRKLALCAENSLCGDAGRQMLHLSGLAAETDVIGADGAATIAQVNNGDATAALVFNSDIVAASGKVDAVAIPAIEDFKANYFIAQLTDAANKDLAGAFIEFVNSDRGIAILEKYGFSAG